MRAILICHNKYRVQMPSNKRKSVGTVDAIATAAVSVEEQRKRARLWKEQQLGSSAQAAVTKPAASRVPAKESRRVSMSALESSLRKAAAPSAQRSSARTSLAPLKLSRRDQIKSEDEEEAISSPTPKKPKVAVDRELTVEEQRERARLWRQQSLKAPVSASAAKTRRAGAETTPQSAFDESDIPDSLKPSRATSVAGKVNAPRSTRRASLDSAMSVEPVARPAGRASIAGSASERRKGVAVVYGSPEDSSSDDADTVVLVQSTRQRSQRRSLTSISAPRRGSEGSTVFDESIYAYPADFRHQYRDRLSAELSSPESAGGPTPLHAAVTSSPTLSRRGSRRISSIKKTLLPADSSSEEDAPDSSDRVGLSFSEQRGLAKRRVGVFLAASTSSQVPLALNDPDAIEMAEPPESLPPQKQLTSEMKRKNAWFGEIIALSVGVAFIGMLLVVRAKDNSDFQISLSMVSVIPSLVPIGQAELHVLRESFNGFISSFSNGLEFTLTSIRAVSLALLSIAVVFPVVYGLLSMTKWCWRNAQKKSDLIETMADEVKDLLFNKYEGGPYPIVFLMENLMDKYRREGCGKAIELLSPGETFNRAAFRRLWPSVEKEVVSDARVEILNRTFEGKIHACWRVVGGKGTIHSTHIASDFTTDDFGHEDAHSKSAYTPAKVHGPGMSFL